jgi:hypothetical protein
MSEARMLTRRCRMKLIWPGIRLSGTARCRVSGGHIGGAGLRTQSMLEPQEIGTSGALFVRMLSCRPACDGRRDWAVSADFRQT